jgi:hypothetical protein
MLENIGESLLSGVGVEMRADKEEDRGPSSLRNGARPRGKPWRLMLDSGPKAQLFLYPEAWLTALASPKSLSLLVADSGVNPS